MDTINGIPAHPLFVHIPVVLVPLVAIGVVTTIVRPQWYLKYRWLLLILGAVAMVGTFLAAETGEGLEEALPPPEQQRIHDHAEAGERAEILVFLFFLALIAYVVLPWYLRRHNRRRGDTGTGMDDGPSWMRPVLVTVVALTAIVATGAVISAGDTGASEVWKEGLPAAVTPSG